MSQRVQFIDRLKGFAILSVILGHLCMWQLGGYNTPTWFVNTFHMPVFLFLSGFVVTPPSFLKLIKKSIQFLIPGLIIGSAFAYYRNFDVVSFLCHDSKLGYWYLFVLSGYYVLMMLYHYLNAFDGEKGLFIDLSLAVIIFVGLAGLHLLLGKMVSDLFCVYKMFTFWPVFFFGYMVKKHQKLKDFVFSNIGYTIALIVYAVGLYLSYKEFWYYIGIPMGLFAAAFLANLFQRRENSTSLIERELARLGRGSLDVYIFHFFFLWTISLHPFGTYCQETGNLLLFVLVAAVLSVIIAYLCLLVGYILKSSSLLQTIIFGKR
jgi:fucose 4-O-acetylase-like acetyltransferase